MANNGADVVGQVGTNWVHCNGTTPDELLHDGLKANENFKA